MKVGTDAVLLGTLTAPTEEPFSILDIGTGCGIIALMMAQRFENATITAIDIHSGSVEQAQENFQATAWNERLHAELTPVQALSRQKFDLIVSNPPFFENSLKAPEISRSNARHTDTLPFDQLAQYAGQLLNDNGEFWCILPLEMASRVIVLCSQVGLHLNTKNDIQNRPKSPFKRTILGFSWKEDTTIEHHYSIRNDDNTYSDWYRAITSPFYTHLR